MTINAALFPPLLAISQRMWGVEVIHWPQMVIFLYILKLSTLWKEMVLKIVEYFSEQLSNKCGKNWVVCPFESRVRDGMWWSMGKRWLTDQPAQAETMHPIRLTWPGSTWLKFDCIVLFTKTSQSLSRIVFSECLIFEIPIERNIAHPSSLRVNSLVRQLFGE